jgi:flagellar protein FlaG
MSMSAIDRIMTGNEETVVPIAPHTAAKSQSPNMDAKVIYQSPPLTASPEKVTGGEHKAIDKKLLEKIVDKLSQQFRSKNTSLNFSIDDATQSLVVKVIDSDSEKVIRQIPPEEILAIRARIQELLGALIDKEA